MISTAVLRACTAICSAVPAAIEWEGIRRTMFHLPEETIGEYEARYKPAKVAFKQAMWERRGASTPKLIDAAHRIAVRRSRPTVHVFKTPEAQEAAQERGRAMLKHYGDALPEVVAMAKEKRFTGSLESDRLLAIRLCEAVMAEPEADGDDYSIAVKALDKVCVEARLAGAEVVWAAAAAEE